MNEGCFVIQSTTRLMYSESVMFCSLAVVGLFHSMDFV